MNFLCSDRKASPQQLARALAMLCTSAILVAGCARKPSVAADQPIPVQLRAPHRLHRPSSVAASGSVEADSGLQAARRSVTARTEIVRITSDQVVAKTNYESALKDARARLADSKAQLFDAEMQHVLAQAELVRTEGRQ